MKKLWVWFVNDSGNIALSQIKKKHFMSFELDEELKLFGVVNINDEIFAVEVISKKIRKKYIKKYFKVLNIPKKRKELKQWNSQTENLNLH